MRLLFIAGFETTVNAIGNGMHWLLADREQWETLVADPNRAAAVAEEVLRFDPPVQQTARVAHQPVQVADVLVARNQWVITLLAAANRDPEVYSEPNRFDITRESPAEHLAFSGGIHYCLGSPLARLELTQAFRALAERFPNPAGRADHHATRHDPAWTASISRCDLLVIALHRWVIAASPLRASRTATEPSSSVLSTVIPSDRTSCSVRGAG